MRAEGGVLRSEPTGAGNVRAEAMGKQERGGNRNYA